MYNPYQAQLNNDTRSQSPGYPSQGVNITNQYEQQQQQQHGQQQTGYPQQHQGSSVTSGKMNGNPNGAPFNTFFSDPATQMGLQFSQTAFNASQQYMQQNLGQLVTNNDIKYYFKVSNSYVLKKLFLVLFPYRNKSWIRQLKGSGDATINGQPAADVYATPIEDVNAPDLYIPVMSFLSYILLWALKAGVSGDFHPEMLGYATTRTLAFYLMDFVLLRISFYVLGINSRSSKMWDLVSYTGYKFVPILVFSLLNGLIKRSIILRYFVLGLLVFSHGFFLMRSLKYVVLPGGGYGGESRMRMQYLFLYCFVIQGGFLWLLT